MSNVPSTKGFKKYWRWELKRLKGERITAMKEGDLEKAEALKRESQRIEEILKKW